MLRYKDAQGVVFTGSTPAAVVRQMRSRSWHTRNKRAFMLGVSKRLSVLGTKGTAHRSCKEFLESLVSSGWLKPC